MTQPSLLDHVVAPNERKPRKRMRQVSKETYNVLADTGALGAASTKVLRSLKAYINRYQDPPTAAELCHWMFITGVIKRENVNFVAPRIADLANGRVNRKTGERIGGHEIELLPLRICAVSKNKAHPVRPREKGSQEPR